MENLLVVKNETTLSNFAQFAHEADAGQVQFLKFTKNGQFIYGQEESIVDEDDLFAANLNTLSRGYICWKDGVVVGEVMALVSTSQQVPFSSLPAHGPYEGGDGWKEQSSIEFENLNTGDTLEFKSSSKGGRVALGALSREFIDNLKRGEDKIVPVVSMVATNYKHDKYGKIYNPKFEVDHWLGGNNDAEDEVVEETPPKRKRQNKPQAKLKT